MAKIETFDQALRAISDLAPRGWRLGLERMQQFVEIAGLSDVCEGKSTQFIQVAGTNGKGSVTAYLQSLLVDQGYRTGAFFSPYVYDPLERVQIGRDLIDKQLFTQVAIPLLELAEQMEQEGKEAPTEFEMKTAIGLAAWRAAQAEWVALEVGLGGRLDATSVVQPSCGVIVSIGFDHMSILGNTLASIAREKAGILKVGMPLVLGQMDEEARSAILKVAEKRESKVWEFGREVQLEPGDEPGTYHLSLPTRHFENLPVPFEGCMQPHNMALAVAALELSGALREPESVRTGLSKAKIPGRMEQRLVEGVTVILDGAHNQPSIEALMKSLETRQFNRLIVVGGMLQGHEAKDVFEAISMVAQEIHVSPIDFFRAQPADAIAREVSNLCSEQPNSVRLIHVHSSAAAAIETALHRATPEDLVLVTGSFYLVGEIGNYLSLREESHR